VGSLLPRIREIIASADPFTIAVATTLCLATAVAGCLRPALHAARVDPLSALREE
jgi:ABC-type lipoprotein release transport system permease subunit